MTIFQIATLVIFGPIGLWSLTNLLDIYFRKVGKFSPLDAFTIVVSTVMILVAFLGVIR